MENPSIANSSACDLDALMSARDAVGCSSTARCLQSLTLGVPMASPCRGSCPRFALPTHFPPWRSHRRFTLYDPYGILPTVCGRPGEQGNCTSAGVEADSVASCTMPLEAVLLQLEERKVWIKCGNVWG